MSVAVGVVNLVLIFFLARTAGNRTGMRKIFWPALVLRLFAGLCVGGLYMYYYGSGDTLNYFADAVKLSGLAVEDPSEYVRVLFQSQVPGLELIYETPRALFFTKVVSLFTLITANNYWITGLYLSFISFLGAWFLVQTLTRLFPKVRLAAIASFLFLPSMVFWTSGLLKESLAMGGLFFLSALVVRAWCGESLRAWHYAVGLLMLLIVWNLKYYYLAAFIPVSAALLAYRYLLPRKLDSRPFLQAVVFLGLLILPLALVSILHPNFNFDRILDVIVLNNATYTALSEPGNLVLFEDLSPTWSSILQQSPWALFSGLFRPHFWEATTIVQFVAGVENSVLLLIFLASLLRIRRYDVSRNRLLILATLTFVVILGVFLTLSAPNFGTLSRYRAGYLAFFVCVILCENPMADYVQRRFLRLVRQ